MAEKNTPRPLALALSVLWTAVYVALYSGGSAILLPKGSWPGNVVPSLLWEWLFEAGTLAALPLCALIALRKAKLAGALLLLASATASIGLSIHAGPRLWLYFTGFLIAVLPQCLIGYLLYRDNKPKKISAPPRKHPR